MTESPAMDERAVEAGQRAAMEPNGCGCAWGGEHVFCDDERLPQRFAACQCKKDARAAIAAYEAAKPVAVGASAEMVKRAFEIGYCWRGMLIGQTLEDSRAVCRTLGADVFEGLDIDASEVPGFETADIGIYHAKRAIRKALVAEAASRLESLESAWSAEPAAWEFFQDEGYFGMWCVRQAGASRFGDGFHVVSQEEARALHALLSAHPTPEASDV